MITKVILQTKAVGSGSSVIYIDDAIKYLGLPPLGVAQRLYDKFLPSCDAFYVYFCEPITEFGTVAQIEVGDEVSMA